MEPAVTLANHLIAKVSLPHASGLPADVVTNTFHFSKPNAQSVSDAANEAADFLIDFYTAVPAAHGVSPTPTKKVGEWIGSGQSRTTNACLIEVYDGSVAPPRVPIVTAAFTLPAALGTAQLPNEVALCASYRNVVAGVPPAQTRGRIYLGPLYSGASVSTPSGGWVRPDNTSNPNPVGTFCAAMATLVDDSYAAFLAGTGPMFGVYSTVLNFVTHPNEVWVDNEFDVQRRRGGESTARTAVTGL